MAELVNEYRSLLWGAVFMMIGGTYAFTFYSIGNLQRESDRTNLAMQLIDKDVRTIKDTQTRALVEREAQFKDIYRRVDELQARAAKGR